MNKKLIVNADDLGQSGDINRGIFKCYEKGIVTSASLMVRYPAAMEAALYAEKNPGLGVGLHIDLGEWMNDKGDWKTLYEVVNIEDAVAVKEEVLKQLDAFYSIMGRRPTHMDSHQHVHTKEHLKPLISEIAQGLDVTLRRCSERVTYCGDFYGQLMDGSPWHDAISTGGLLNIISTIKDPLTEMACHPGLDENIKTMYRKERLKEVDTLCDPRVKQALKDEGIELCSFEGIPF